MNITTTFCRFLLLLQATVGIYAFCGVEQADFHDKCLFMRHRHGFNRLGRPADQRKALLRSLTTSLIRFGRIKTTSTKAKALRNPVEHMITLAKIGSDHCRRQALSYLYDKDLVASLFEQAPLRYANRSGGYSRIIQSDVPRRGDNADMAVIELV